jgi:putative SOS response-associated peptidase YedK
LLQPYSDESMRAWKVSRRVNNPRLPNDEHLIEPH